MKEHAQELVQDLKEILTDFDWRVKETTAAKYIQETARGNVNESYGVYTKPRQAFKASGWAGLTTASWAGIYVTLPYASAECCARLPGAAIANRPSAESDD